jgi:PTH1 family peptidyl-tRNA hydrolase
MKIVFGQGNPGDQYTRTRHNVGFTILDAFANKLEVSWSNRSKFKAMMAETTIGDEKLLLIKPSTFYNDTGIAASQLIDFYDLDVSKDVLVIHDDLALPFGTIRTRKKGSDAGNNGIKSLNAHIGTSYHRIRIGIYNDLRDCMNDSDFVLSNFTKDESTRLEESVAPHIIETIEKFCTKDIEITSKKL